MTVIAGTPLYPHSIAFALHALYPRSPRETPRHRVPPRLRILHVRPRHSHSSAPPRPPREASIRVPPVPLPTYLGPVMRHLPYFLALSLLLPACSTHKHVASSHPNGKPEVVIYMKGQGEEAEKVMEKVYYPERPDGIRGPL